MAEPRRVTSVMIVGGGTAGLTSSILLSALGVETILVERHSQPSRLPKAHILNQRTMEIFREAGIAASIYEHGAPLDAMCRAAWYTSFAGPTPAHGREVAKCDAWGGGRDQARYELASPCRLTNLPQSQLEPLLVDAALSRSEATVLFDTELVNMRQEDARVLAEVRNRVSGATYEIEAQYMVAADGGRTVGQLIGTVMEGQHDIVKMVSTHFRADLSRELPDPSVAITRFVNPDGPGREHRGNLVQMGGGGWGRGCREWIFSFSLPFDTTAVPSGEETAAAIRHTLGLPSLDIDVLRVSEWNVEGLVARRLIEGRVVLIGDAAHRHPPSGGLGLNSAVQDAHNLAWKIAYILRGDAPASLLESYHAERRPIAVDNMEHSLRNFFDNQDMDRALGHDQASTAAEKWRALGTLFSSTAAGAQMRVEVDRAADGKRRAQAALNVELGFRYVTGALIAEPEGSDDSAQRSATEYVPTCTPGGRVPHVWLALADGSFVSTVDLPQGSHFVLITNPIYAAGAWRHQVERVRAMRPGLPLVHVVFGEDVWDETGAWAELAGADGVVLVRPDGHIAWRSAGGPADGERLTSVLDAVLAST